MASQKTTLKITIKELHIEYEGDRESAQSVQQGIQNTITGLVSTPALALDYKPAQKPTDELIDTNLATPAKKRRRRKANGAADQNGDGVTPSRAGAKPKAGKSIPAQILELRAEDFFAQDRKATDVQEGLSEKGFNFNPSSVAMALMKLTQEKKLSRAKDSKGVFVYKNGSKS